MSQKLLENLRSNFTLRRFWPYLPQLLSDFQNLKTDIHRKMSPSSGKSWLSPEQLVCRHRWRHDDKIETLPNFGLAAPLQVLNIKAFYDPPSCSWTGFLIFFLNKINQKYSNPAYRHSHFCKPKLTAPPFVSMGIAQYPGTLRKSRLTPICAL